MPMPQWMMRRAGRLTACRDALMGGLAALVAAGIWAMEDSVLVWLSVIHGRTT